MMISTNNIFTIQTDKNHKANIVQIETLITNGLYRFTLLGMLSKYASDTKDRAYSALRSSNLLNLKSDNRKIIVNLSPDETDKKEGVYDLGIALSILSCLEKKLPELSIIALGGLSISGKIISSQRLNQAIYTAYKNNIRIIVCSTDDLKYIDKINIEILKSLGIQIISANTLTEAVELLRNFSILQVEDGLRHRNEDTTISQALNDIKINFSNLDSLTRAILISLCGGHHIMIQTTLTGKVGQYCGVLSRFACNDKIGFIAYASFEEKLRDDEVFLPNFFIENIKNISKNFIKSLQTKHRNSVIALYTPCSCGYRYNFFDPTTQERRCICSQKTVLQHKRLIESNYFEFFNMHITTTRDQFCIPDNAENIIKVVKSYQFERYVREQGLKSRDIALFPDNSFLNQYRDISKIESVLDKEAYELWSTHGREENVIRLAQTIQDIIEVTGSSATKKPAVSKQALVLAISYMPKMDF